MITLPLRPFLRCLSIALVAAPLTAQAVVIQSLRPFATGSGNGDPEPAQLVLYNQSNGAQDLTGWRLLGPGALDEIALPPWVMPAGTYLTVVLGPGTDDPDFSDSTATYNTGPVGLVLTPDGGELGLYRGLVSDSTARRSPFVSPSPCSAPASLSTRSPSWR